MEQIYWTFWDKVYKKYVKLNDDGEFVCCIAPILNTYNNRQANLEKIKELYLTKPHPPVSKWADKLLKKENIDIIEVVVFEKQPLANNIDEIINKIVDDIRYRQGIGSEWDYIDEDIKTEIKDEWKNIIKDSLK